MKNIKRTALCIGLIFATVLSCLSVGAAYGTQSSSQDRTQIDFTDTSEFTEVLSNNSFSLFYCADKGALKVANKNNKVWNSYVTEDIFDTSMSTDTFLAYMNSLLAINYCKKDDNSGNYIRDYSSLMSNTISVYSLSDGISVDCEFAIPKISITVEIRLTDTGLNVKIPQESIKEDGEYILYSVEVLPFFSAAAQTDDGYLFYPDGSGAVTEFKTSMDKSRFTDELVLDVYSELEDDELLTENRRKVMLSVYGIKRNDTAFLACADSGGENLSIHVSPAIPMSMIGVNYSYFEFKYRGQYRVYLSNSVKANQDTENLQYKLKLEKAMIKGDREMSIFLLEGEDADYSGMANAYREHLLKQGALRKERLDKTQAVSLDIYMSVKNPDSFFGGKVVSTDFEQTEKILGSYLENGVEKLNARLVGWSDDGGQLPQKPKVSKEAGGNKGLKALDSFVSENSDKITLTLTADTILTSNKRLASLMGNLIPISDKDKQTFLTTPQKAVGSFNKFIRLANKFKSIKISAGSIGQTVYNDYKKSRKTNRQQTVKNWEKSLENEAVYAVQGGNLYTLNKTSYLYDIPIASSGYPLTDYSVPFYQMVVHGHIAYSAQCPANLSPDIDAEYLKWIEYGCVPYFILTGESPEILAGTSAATLFSSQNSNWQSEIVDIYKTLKEEISVLGSEHIVKHERINKNLSALTYESGATVIINYADFEQQYGGINVAAKSFRVKGVDGK